MRLVGTFYSAGDVSGVTVVDNIAFIADRTNGLETINVSDPAHPTFVGVYGGMDARDVAVANNIAFVAIGDQGLKIIDVSNPVQPMLMGSYDTPGSARGVTVVGDTAFVADLDSLQLINISDPANPALLSSIGYDNGLLGAIYNVTVQGNTVFLAASGAGVQLFDITDLSNPISLSSYDTSGFSNAVTVQDNTAFVADDSGGFQLIDISDLSNPQLLGAYGANGGYPKASAISGDTAFVAVGLGGLQVIDISSPANPTFLDVFDFYDGSNHYANDVAINGDYAYVADGTGGLKIVTTAKASVLEITATDANKAEGAGDNIAFTFTVSRTGDTASSCTVSYEVNNISLGVGFFHDAQSPLGGLLNFAENEISKVITIKVVGDTVVEPDQTFDVMLSNPYHATLGTTTATGTIRNDDAALSITTTDADKGEGSGAFTFTVNRSGDTASTSTVDYNVSGGLASSDDFTNSAGTLVFAADEVSKVIGIDVADDSVSELDELFNVVLSNASGATLDITTATGMIRNDDVDTNIPTLGNDTLLGTADNDTLSGLAGDDNIFGLEGNDVINGDSGADAMIGGSGNDTLTGGLGKDKLNGGAGTDKLSGDSGNDVLTGGLGKDNLNGGAGADKLLGGSGNDVLIGGLGKDKLNGGVGADKFKFNSTVETGIKASARDTIVDFKSLQHDKIDLSEIDANTAAKGNNAFTSPTVGAAFSGSFTKPGALYFDKTNHILYGNNDADNAADFSIALSGVTSINVTDFIL
ncbi:MAG: Calx-beta domain-containing protein [Methylovulum sp.]|nr:Calx-beta domain-containing protein [Methylovulum sp.]